jgi:hypothetical protein
MIQFNFHETRSVLEKKIGGKKVFLGTAVERKHKKRLKKTAKSLKCMSLDSTMDESMNQTGEKEEFSNSVLQLGIFKIFVNTFYRQ